VYLLSTLGKVWDADLCLQTLVPGSSRIADLALVERRVHTALPTGAFTPRELRDRALDRIGHAGAVFGAVELDGVVQVMPVWRPLLDALADIVNLRWRAPEGSTACRGRTESRSRS
jgi:hypothetical protein